MFPVRHDIYLKGKSIQSARRFQGKNTVEYEIRVRQLCINGEERYYDSDGELHRDNGPALIDNKGEYWYCHGKLHRVDGPAVIQPKVHNRMGWYQHGLLHREEGPAFTQSGVEKWYQQGKLHRQDEPAVTHKGIKEWWENGIRIK